MVRKIITWAIVIGLIFWFFGDTAAAVDDLVTIAKACGRIVGEVVDGISGGASSVSVTRTILNTATQITAGPAT